MPRFGHLDIGEGVGDAKAYNPLPIVQQYAQNLANQKAKHEAEVKDLGDALAKSYDPNGLRNDADRKKLLSMYQDVKQAGIDAENEKDATKKALALSEVRQKMAQLGAFTEGSKNLGKFEQAAAKESITNQWAVADDSKQKLIGQADKAWDDPNNIKGWTDIQRGVNPEKVVKSYEEHKKQVQKEHPATFDNGVIQGKDPFGRPVAVSHRVIPMDGDNGAFESTLHWVAQDKDAQNFIQNTYTPEKYPQLQNPNPQVALALKTRQFMHDNGDANGFVESKEVKGQFPDKVLQHHIDIKNWDLKHGFGKDQANNIVENIYGKKDAAGNLEALNKAYESKFGKGIDYADDGDNVHFVIPPEQVRNPNWSPGIHSKYVPEYIESKPAKTIDVSRTKDPLAFKAAMYEALSKVGGATNMSKYVKTTEEQKPKIYTIKEGKFKGQNIPENIIHEKAVKAGVSDQEYIDWLHKQK